MHATIEAAARRLADAGRVVALTGAGVSAESGLDTFRGADGIWARFDPDEVAAAGGWLGYLIARPWDGMELLRGIRDAFGTAEPNDAHRALAELESIDRLHALITQNIDGLHRAAGSTHVIEMHGTFRRKRCSGCGGCEDVSRERFVADIDAMIARLGSFLVHHPAHLLDRCPCGGLLRPDIVGFGDAVHGLVEATEAVDAADVVLVCGTSGVVYPAASLPERARERGAVVIEIDPLPTELTPLADISVRDSAGRALPALVDAVRRVGSSV